MDLEARVDVQRFYNAENNTQATFEVSNLRAKTIFYEERVRHLDEHVRSYE